ncbi:hypothetical protein H9Q10_11375 [Eikenella sp. S3360]|uniref:YqjK-like protein n=1 Tax=Eikenella glucosivorans TaxID=2766967 RepID=A0ABS0ND57_9NEIS|nr:hypothetical protein [Eikenella glucosivorans]MBH5330263.1 hypothetical protein [Eikenella glucosivorans]
MSSPISKRQQRELLALQAELARLKIRAEQLKQRKRQQQGRGTDWQRWLKLADRLPLAMLLWQAAVLPPAKQRALLPKAGRMLWRWWRSLPPEPGK